MKVFLGTYENKIDRKGRVSIPAPYRQVLAAQDASSLVFYPSLRTPSIEGCSMEYMEQITQNMSSFNLNSPELLDLSMTYFGDTYPLPIDAEGRVILPEGLIAHAGLSERAAFMGMGPTFNIWEPEALAAMKAEARQRAQTLTVPQRPADGGR